MESLAKFFNHDFFEEGSFELYDNNGNRIYYEDAIGNRIKVQYKKDSYIVIISSGRYWSIQEYDNNKNNLIYHEDSDGFIKDNRPKCENKTVVIDGVKYELRRK